MYAISNQHFEWIVKFVEDWLDEQEEEKHSDNQQINKVRIAKKFIRSMRSKQQFEKKLKSK